METLLKDGIYVSLSRWPSGDEAHEEHKGAEDVYTSSDEEIKEPPPGSSRRFGAKKAPVRRKRVQKANPNALFVKYGELISEPCISSSAKPLLCSKCQAAVNNLNTKSDNEWQCIFCKTKNKGKITSRPEGPNIKYILGTCGEALIDPCPNYVIIVDRSGSMSITDAENRSVLQVLVEALQNILIEISVKNKNAKVGLIAVNNEIAIFGDCNSPPKIISDKSILGSEEKLKELANKERGNFFRDNIATSGSRIEQTIRSLEPSGATALGPSIVYGLELLKGFGNGRMIIFTDGLSNEGVGDVEPCKGVVKPEEKEYYTKWAKQAREQGVSINFFIIENSFNIGFYTSVARETEGAAYVVNPAEILTEIGLPEEVNQLGIDAEVTVILPTVLKFWRVIEIGAEVSNSCFRKKYGTATMKTRDILHFVVNPGAMPIEEAKELKTLPVQVKIKWRAMDGKDYLLICTKSFPVITKRSKEVNADNLKDLMDKMSKDMVLREEQDKAGIELGNMLSEYISKSENESVSKLKEEAIAQRLNVINSKTDNVARTVTLAKKSTASNDNVARTVDMRKNN